MTHRSRVIRRHWFTAKEWVLLLDQRGAVSLGTRRNRRVVECVNGHHTAIEPGDGVAVVIDHRSRGFVCRDCQHQLQQAVRARTAIGWGEPDATESTTEPKCGRRCG